MRVTAQGLAQGLCRSAGLAVSPREADRIWAKPSAGEAGVVADRTRATGFLAEQVVSKEIKLNWYKQVMLSLSRAVRPCGVPGPHWKKKSRLGPHVKYV